MRGTSRFTRSINALSAPRSEKSQAYPMNSRPRSTISFSTSLPEASIEALTPTMSAPASANAWAMPRPMPRLHPVTSATLPSSLNRSRIPIDSLLSHAYGNGFGSIHSTMASFILCAKKKLPAGA